MGSSCTCQSNNSSIQPIISLTKSKKEQHSNGEIKLPRAYSRKMSESREINQKGNQIHHNQKTDFKKEQQLYSNSLIEQLDSIMTNQKKPENQKESQQNLKRHVESIDFYSSQKKSQITKNVNDAAIRGCILQRSTLMEKNFFIDPKTNRIVPNLRPLRNNSLYKKRLPTEEELETDVSIKLKS